MLVLSRRVGEKICIGKGIVVTVVALPGNRVRLGIEAPVEVPIRRAELCPAGKDSWDEPDRVPVLPSP